MNYMNNILYIVFLFGVASINNVYCMNSLKENILCVKNNTLKRLIRNDIQKFRMYLTYIRNVNNTILTKYYNSVNTYMSLNEDEKQLIEFIVSLSY